MEPAGVWWHLSPRDVATGRQESRRQVRGRHTDQVSFLGAFNLQSHRLSQNFSARVFLSIT